ncbi:rhodanese-like domain-containing protein [Alicyclobacillaceae bacterium I2511]|nr:rhodanese-like domain-containing protein [Alicyclobacillaceae bacterium I2511]
MQSWIWVVGLLAAVVAYYVWQKRSNAGIQHIDAASLHEKIKKTSNQMVIVDVREPVEFAGGHIHKAKNIPLGQLPKHIHELPTGKELVFVCRSGSRSLRASRLAMKHGHTAVYNMAGGMSRWAGPVKR